jgi:hypothetical protein
VSSEPNNMFMSPHSYPFNLTSHSLDTYVFLLALYYLQQRQLEPAVMFSADAAQSIGLRRDFILDRLASANNGLAVSKIEYLGIMWSDMHIKDSSTLIAALQPYKRLRHLFLCFVEQTPEGESFRNGMRAGRVVSMSLVKRGESEIRGRFLLRMVDQYEELAERMNEALAKAGVSTVLDVRMVRFEK